MPETPGPNILWVCTDSRRWDTLGCYGNPFWNWLVRLTTPPCRAEACFHS